MRAIFSQLGVGLEMQRDPWLRPPRPCVSQVAIVGYQEPAAAGRRVCGYGGGSLLAGRQANPSALKVRTPSLAQPTKRSEFSPKALWQALHPVSDTRVVGGAEGWTGGHVSTRNVGSVFLALGLPALDVRQDSEDCKPCGCCNHSQGLGFGRCNAL